MERYDFEDAWKRAQEAAQAAAVAQNARLGDENFRGLDCGFAWITFPGNVAFGRWAKEKGIASPGYPKGLQIWYSKLHSVPTQSISVHEAAASAALKVFRTLLPDVKFGFGSRLD